MLTPHHSASRALFLVAPLALILAFALALVSTAASTAPVASEPGPVGSVPPGCGSTTGDAMTHVRVSPDHDLSQQVLPPADDTVADRIEPATRLAQDDGADWVEVDTVSFRHVLGAGSRATVRFIRDDEKLRAVLPADGLTPTAREAVVKAPSWMSETLADNLRRMGTEAQDTFAALILSAEDPVVDEIAFQVARVAPASLTHELFTPQLIVDNATQMYAHDEGLQYVNIVDHGSAAAGGDYYSTTAYRYAADDGTTSWVEISRDIYYWWVLHPKLSDETVKQSDEASERQATYGHFWREYLFLDPHPVNSYAVGNQWAESYPVLGDVLTRPTVFWDGVRQDSLPKGRPFTDEDTALDAVGNWVSKVLPKKAIGNRPVQPNQIAYEHNGNCGEIQDLLGAAARTGLIPVLLTSNPCEDHVWNEFFWGTDEDDWHPYQVSWDGGPTHIDNPGIGYDFDHGGSKDVSGVWAWRPDGYVFDVVQRYSITATLEIQVVDAADHPIDGAQVRVYSDAWKQEGRFNIVTWGFTDSDGRVRFTIGDSEDFYVRVITDLGNYPPEDNRITRVITDSKADEAYGRQVKISGGTVPQREHTVAEVAGDLYKLTVNVDVPQQIVYGRNLFGEGADFAKWEDDGAVTLYGLDQRAHAYLSFGQKFEASVAATLSVSGTLDVKVPDMGGDWFVVLANERQVNAQVIEAEVTLLRNEAYERPVVYLPLVARSAELGTPTTH